MKLQSLGIVFALIILPIVLILSYYIQMQVDTIALQTSYDSKLLDATHDALFAFEINTANEDLSAVSDSLRSIIEASNSIFFNTLATNFGMSNVSKSHMQPYIPAILYTLYDGYYIYSPTEQPEILKYGDRYAIDNGLETPEEIATGSKDGQVLLTIDGQMQYKQKDGSYSTELNENTAYKQDFLLKSYMPYSARYVNDANKIDVTINYTLDNYINIVGTIGDIYYSKTGYLINPDMVQNISVSGLADNEILKYNEADAENICQSGNYTITVTLKDGTQMTTSGCNVKAKRIELKKLYEKYQAGDSSVLGTIRNMEVEIANAQAVSYYVRSKIFSEWVYTNLAEIKESDIVEDMSEVNAESFTTKYQEEDFKNIFYEFKNKNNKIFDRTQNPEKESTFTNHKDQVIRNSIQFNLNVAFSTYSKMSEGEFTFEMPLLSDSEWEKIVNRVSILSFMQGVPCGSKMYSNYSLVSSTNNELTVIPEEIYYVPANKFNDKITSCHRIDCPELPENNEDGTPILDYISFKSKELKYDKIYNKQTSTYMYDHKNISCYNCIINKNYLKTVRNEAGAEEQNYSETIDETTLSALKKKNYYMAIAKERQNLYKTNALTESEGYEKLFLAENETAMGKTLNPGQSEIKLNLSKDSTRTIDEVKGIQIVLNNLKSSDINATTVKFKVYIKDNYIGEKTLTLSKYSKNQTIELSVDPRAITQHKGQKINNNDVKLVREGTLLDKINFYESYINIIYK